MASARTGVHAAVTHGAKTRPLAASLAAIPAARPHLAGLVAEGGVGLRSAIGVAAPLEDAAGLPVLRAQVPATRLVTPLERVPLDEVRPVRETPDTGVPRLRVPVRPKVDGALAIPLAATLVGLAAAAAPPLAASALDVAINP